MSRFNSKNFNINDDKQKVGSNAQGKTFLELLLQESSQPLPEDELIEEELEEDLDEPLAEIPIPDRKKKFKFLRFPKLKAMLDMLDHTEPEKADAYVIMDNQSEAPKLEEIEAEAEERDDTEEFLNKIGDKLRHFGRLGKRLEKENESGNVSLESDDDEAFEAGVVKSITQDEQIVSETLAELLAAQGQKTKAIKMYKALILKFPEKSLFFAKKIEELS